MATVANGSRQGACAEFERKRPSSVSRLHERVREELRQRDGQELQHVRARRHEPGERRRLGRFGGPCAALFPRVHENASVKTASAGEQRAHRRAERAAIPRCVKM